MPKIEAETVREHRRLVRNRLIDSAEELLRENPEKSLTAQAVANKAGVARNSIYRYVDSVNDLVGLVIKKHLPTWLHEVEVRVGHLSDPADRIVEWVRANLEQSARSGHSWLMTVAAHSNISTRTSAEVKSTHQEFKTSLINEWKRVGSLTPQIHAALTRAILEASFRMVDQAAKNEDLQQQIIDTTVRSVSALVRDVQSRARRH